VAFAERSLSKIELIKIYLRAGSGQSRVVYFDRLNIESKLALELKHDDIIKTFSEKARSVFKAIVTFAPTSENVNCLHIISD